MTKNELVKHINGTLQNKNYTDEEISYIRKRILNKIFETLLEISTTSSVGGGYETPIAFAPSKKAHKKKVKKMVKGTLWDKIVNETELDEGFEPVTDKNNMLSYFMDTINESNDNEEMEEEEPVVYSNESGIVKGGARNMAKQLTAENKEINGNRQKVVSVMDMIKTAEPIQLENFQPSVDIDFDNPYAGVS